MSEIFISHSTEDKEIVKKFVEFLQTGMGISRDQIFCTSYPNTLPTGMGFIEKIREELKDCEAAMFLITEKYLQSNFCMAELGAAWGLGKRIFPLVLVDVGRLEGTPLKGIQMRRLDSKKDISTVYDELCSCKIIKNPSTAEYMERVPGYINAVKTLAGGDYLLELQQDGYYHTEISAVRQNVPTKYRCYKVKGHIEQWEEMDAAKTDWLFYYNGTYEELKVGDKVRFKVSKTEEKTFNDIGKVRNIYPADLVKE